MSACNGSAIPVPSCTLPFAGIKAFFLEVLLVGSAVVLPVIAHLINAPVRFLLPMHWPVILAGLVYGWRAGMFTGLLAPVVSCLLSGLPLPNILPSMTVELTLYGLVTGMLREKFGLNLFLSIGIALVIGRMAFIAMVLLQCRVSTTYLAYFEAALLPGLMAAAAQIILLPFLAGWWVDQGQGKHKISKG